MRKYIFLITMLLAGLSGVVNAGESNEKLSVYIQQRYAQVEYAEKPDFEVYRKAVIGYLNLKKAGSLGEKELLAIIDFSKSSNEKRLWIIDMKSDRVIYHNLVAHGKNTGNEFARHFSNIPNSNKSSLGFYVTAENYVGKHGLSLRLDGMEAGFNDNARKRAIVMHGANYVDGSFSRSYGRIGRSFGCPAIPVEGHERILKEIAGGTCLFIYYPDDNYISRTTLLNEDTAMN